jgi:tRNA A-37 threonylcarbamoyl transferase component Bud32
MSLEGRLTFEEASYPGRHSVVDAVLETGGASIPVVVKKTRTTWRQRLRITKGERSFATAQALLARGIPTPEPLGFRVLEDESWYVARRVEPSAQIRAWFLARDDPRAPAPPFPIAFEDVVRALGRLARRMHDAGVFFRDLSDGNVLVAPAGSSFDLYLVDLNRARLGSPVGRYRRLRDLSRPGLNRAADRALLLESYFAPGKVPAGAEAVLAAFRRRLVLWDELKRRARPWRRRGRPPGAVSSGHRTR